MFRIDMVGILWLILPLVVNGFSLRAMPKRTFLQQIDRILTKLQNPKEQLKNHTYLTGNYAPVRDILVNELVEVVEGSIPFDLDGMYCRNGPNPVYNSRRYHWFDGDAMLHNLRFDGQGRAFYTNQYVPCEKYQIEQKIGESVFPGLGEYTGIIGLLKILIGPAMVRDFLGDYPQLTALPPNTACLMYFNRFYCLNEGNVPFECRICPDGRLERGGFEFFDDTLNYPFSAHPRIDHDTGDLLFHSYTTSPDVIKRDGTMKVGRFSADTGRVENYFSPTDKEHTSFAHNLMITEKHMILYDCSVHFDAKAMFEGGSFFKTNPSFNLRFGVMSKTCNKQEDVTWIDTGTPGAIVHPLNSWEEKDGTIVIWTPFCENLVMDMENDEINQFRMTEFRLHPDNGTVSIEVIDDTVNVEFSVAPRMGTFVRYGFTAIQDPSTPGEGSFSGFCVWDMKDRKLHAKVYYDGPGGEPAIVVCGAHLYVGVYIQKGLDTFFDLYDGETSKRIFRLRMPSRVPYGFHGLWITANELRSHWEYHSE